MWYRALSLKPDFAEAHYALGGVLSAKGDQDAAVTELREALRLKADFADVHYALAKLLAAKGKKEEATREFAEAQRLNPNLKPPANKPPQ